jgi:hypothetical protein
MSLPLAWIDRIWEKLTVTYGANFLARWRDFDAQALNAVKSDWMNELSGFERAPHAIAFALANLPERAPNVVEFRNLCRQAPAADVPKLPEPKADPARLAAELAKLAPLREKLAAVPAKDCKQWTRDILANPSGRTPTVLQMARNALGGA